MHFSSQYILKFRLHLHLLFHQSYEHFSKFHGNIWESCNSDTERLAIGKQRGADLPTRLARLRTDLGTVGASFANFSYSFNSLGHTYTFPNSSQHPSLSLTLCFLVWLSSDCKHILLRVFNFWIHPSSKRKTQTS